MSSPPRHPIIPSFVSIASSNLMRALHARGVMLFGSRARADEAGKDDDWDVVAVLRNFSPLPQQARLDEIVANDIIHARSISQDELFEQSTNDDHIASSMARDGLLIRGHVTLPAAALPANVIRELTRRQS